MTWREKEQGIHIHVIDLFLSELLETAEENITYFNFNV